MTSKVSGGHKTNGSLGHLEMNHRREMMSVDREKRQAYYCSREWGLKKEAVHQRSGGVCERCHKNPGEAVHHKTYIRLFNELLTDLWHLCSDCHDFVHGRGDVDHTIAKKINIVGTVMNFWCGGSYVCPDASVRGFSLIEHHASFIVDMPTLIAGWQKIVCPRPDKLLDGRDFDGSHIGLVANGFMMPRRKELDDLDKIGQDNDPWKFINMVVMRRPDVRTNRDFNDAAFTFIASSRGDLAAIGSLCKVYGQKIRTDENVLPIVVLDSDEYVSEKSGIKIIVPVFNIYGWTDPVEIIKSRFR